MLLHRRREIATEIEGYRARINALEAEDQELAAAERVLSRFGGSREADVLLEASKQVHLAQAKNTAGKPEGTPTTPNMIVALLREAMMHNKPGLEPREMQIAIARRWWPSVKSEDVGPTAWRMWKAGRLDKDGSLYRLPSSHGLEKEAADLLEKGDQTAS
jgi:hypothetical protein